MKHYFGILLYTNFISQIFWVNVKNSRVLKTFKKTKKSDKLSKQKKLTLNKLNYNLLIILHKLAQLKY